MLFNNDSFAAYDGKLFDVIDFENFKAGKYGLTLDQLKTIDGLGAQTLVNIAQALQVQDGSVQLLQYILNNDFTTKYCLSPSFRQDKNEAGEDHIYLVMGDFKITIPEIFEVLTGYDLVPDLLTVKNGADTKVIPAFTFKKEQTGLVRNDKLDPSFIIAANKDIETASVDIADLFETATDPEDLYDKLINYGLVARIGEHVNFAHLKELPVGGYFVSNIFWDDHTFEYKTGEKAGTQGRMAQWKFTAKSLSDNTVYSVDAAPTSFFGKAIGDTKNQTNQNILKQAGKEKGSGLGVIIVIEGHRAVPQGISVDGKVFDNITAGTKYSEARAKVLAAQQASIPTLPPALPPSQVLAVAPKPTKSAEPVAAGNGHKTLDADATTLGSTPGF